MKNSRPRPAPAAVLAATLLAALWLLAAPPAQARPELCEDATRRAASESGVPLDVLRAISLTETGRRMGGQMRPWPWAGNIDGQGFWFDSAEEALEFARQNLSRGRQSFDLGCFQINWRWHGEHFPSPAAMLDPLNNARYAARFLSQLYRELGDWEAAAGAYHSRTPHLASRYRARFARLRADLTGQGLAEIAPGNASATPLADAGAYHEPAREPVVRVNTFPLLQAPPDGPRSQQTASLFAAPASTASAFLPSLHETN